MFSKVLVANRGEIAVRAFRAAYELGAQTVAVFPFEDRNSEHRLKADEAYEIGERGHPVRAYLDPRGDRREPRSRAGADAVYPGYGFLSENPELAEACADAGITFVGPSAEVLTLTGNKARAIAAAQAAGRADPARASSRAPTSTRWSPPRRGCGSRCSSRRSPAAVAAACAGSTTRTTCGRRVETCMREAEGAFGDPTVFIEQAVVDPRHIEVQILADARRATSSTSSSGTARCSGGTRRSSRSPRRRTSTPELRERMCADAVAFAREIGYVNAGTVEFLLDPDGDYVFIEMNPRIQVEHTVTEEVTDVDLVQRPAADRVGGDAGRPRADQDGIRLRGAALQCRITTEDPANGFRPDTGVITTYRSPGGAGVRLDGGTTYTGAEVSRALRLDAGQADLPGPRLRDRGDPGAACGGGVPDPRGGDEHPVPAGGAGRAGLRGRAGDDRVHRGATRSC